jgi:hypothetical protein
LKTRKVTEPTDETVMALGYRNEYDENGKETYYETSKGYWERFEYDENGKETYCENSDGDKEGTKRGSCDGKVIEVDGVKYKLTAV